MTTSATSREIVRSSLTVIAMIAFYVSGALLHVATIIIGYRAAGFVGACLSAFLPVMSQFYWAWMIWRAVGLTWFHAALLFVICTGVLSNILADRS